jgi:hypothetical protein
MRPKAGGLSGEPAGANAGYPRPAGKRDFTGSNFLEPRFGTASLVARDMACRRKVLRTRMLPLTDIKCDLVILSPDLGIHADLNDEL